MRPQTIIRDSVASAYSQYEEEEEPSRSSRISLALSDGEVGIGCPCCRIRGWRRGWDNWSDSSGSGSEGGVGVDRARGGGGR